MNGAAELPPSRTSSPSSSMQITIGVSHHFLLVRRNAHSSAAKPLRRPRARRVKSSSCGPAGAPIALIYTGLGTPAPSKLAEVVALVARLSARPEVARRITVEAALQRIAAER